jgi:hypothetical protein
MRFVRNATRREKFDTAAHHHHQPGGAGAQCVNSHMPTKNYMFVDARRDHSLRVPRPDLSVSLGTPKCLQPVPSRPARAMGGRDRCPLVSRRQANPIALRYGLHAGRTGAADAEQQLDWLILDRTQPAIAGASALPLLAPYASPASEPAIEATLANPDPLIRTAASRALPGALSPRFADAIALLLSGPLRRRARIEAARPLAGTDLLALAPQ